MQEKRRIPPQNLRWLLLVLAADMFAYYGTILINRGAVYHSVQLPLDALIPFVPAMILPYVLAFAQWLTCFALLAWEPTARCRYFALGTVIAELICAACFLIYPTVMANRPVPEGTDLFSRLAAFIFAADDPSRNLFPSLLVKQHVVVDIPAGLLTAELGLLLARLCLRGKKGETL